jgi:hypothetical protein
VRAGVSKRALGYPQGTELVLPRRRRYLDVTGRQLNLDMKNTRSQRLSIAVATSTILASTLAFGLVGCSASGTTSGGSSASTSGGAKSSVKVDPCVLTAAEVGTIVNEPITSAKPDEAECRYSGGGNFFSVNVFPNSAASDWKTQLTVLTVTGKSTVVSGVGDEAHGHGLTLDVRSGSYILNVIGADDSGTTTWPNSAALAKAIIAKLP